MALIWLIVKAFCALYILLLVPQTLSILFTTRTPPDWDCRGRARGEPDVWMPNGVPVPFFNARRMVGLVLLLSIGVSLYFLVPDVYRTASGLLPRG